MQHGEYSLYSYKLSDNTTSITIKDGSQLGTYTLMFTSQGRIVAHDTGGIFGEEKTIAYPVKGSKVYAEITEKGIKLQSGYHGRLSFTVIVNLEAFLVISRIIGEEYFIFDQKDKCLVGENLAYTTSYYITTHTNHLELRQDGSLDITKIEYSRIISIEQDSDGVIRMATDIILPGLGKLNKLCLFLPYEQQRQKLLQSVKRQPNIGSLLKQGERAVAGRLEGGIGRNSLVTYDVFIVDNLQSIKLIRRDNLTAILERKKQDVDLFYNKNQQYIVMRLGDTFLYIYPEPTEGTKGDYYRELSKESSALLSNLNNPLMDPNTKVLLNHINEKVYYEKAAEWRGNLLGKPLDHQIDLAFTRDHLYFLSSETKELLYSKPIKELKIYKQNQHLFLLQEDGLAFLKSSNIQILKMFVHTDEATLPNVWLDQNENPYYYHSDENGLHYYVQQNNLVDSISYRNLAAMQIEPTDVFQGFSKVVVTENDIVKTFYMDQLQLENLLQRAYILEKKVMLKTVETPVIYKSMVRSYSDLLIYEYFGQLTALYKGLDEFYELEISEEERTRKMASYLYYGIQNQRKRMDTISVFLPTMLNRMESDIFSRLFHKELDDKAFKTMQQQLVSITIQMKGNLLEIENSLAHLSSILIGRQSVAGLIEEKKKNGYKTSTYAALGGGIAIMAGLTIGAPLLLGGALMALNTKQSADMMKNQEQLTLAQDNKRNEFFLAKSLEMFDHFMATMLPYYVGRVNDSMFNTYQTMSEIYEPYLTTNDLKNECFLRVAAIYTYLHLPVEYGASEIRHTLLKDVFDRTDTISKDIANNTKAFQMKQEHLALLN
ncbi:hypothetical protein [Sutcliffiella horikoshii]|uniref:hypothetical protein n=1 Tax=Sutcliffiella horikoshii TaxID=79883 RepID=UPI003850ABAC